VAENAIVFDVKVKEKMRKFSVKIVFREHVLAYVRAVKKIEDLQRTGKELKLDNLFAPSYLPVLYYWQIKDIHAVSQRP